MGKKHSIKNRKVLESLIPLFFLCFCQWVQFVNSGFMIQPLIRGICVSLSIIFTLIFGIKSWNYVLFSWAIAILYWNRFYNYTSFVMILIACWMNPKAEKPYIATYFVGVFVALFLYDDCFSHLAIHFIGCLFFFTVYKFVCYLIKYYLKVISFLREEIKRLKKENESLKTNLTSKLELTPEEIMILEELIQGKEIKEISFYSESTVYRLLREAKIRNNCMTNTELQYRYKNEKTLTENNSK